MGRGATFGFGKALSRMREGHLVRRRTWHDSATTYTHWLELEEGDILVSFGEPDDVSSGIQWEATNGDLLAEDWELLDVPRKQNAS